MTARSPRRSPEKAIQREGCRLYQLAGCVVVNFSQARASKQTPGIPDSKIYYVPEGRALPAGFTWWHEWKTEGGVASPEQLAIHAMMQRCNEKVVVGGIDAVKAQLCRIGLAIYDASGRFVLTRRQRPRPIERVVLR